MTRSRNVLRCCLVLVPALLAAPAWALGLGPLPRLPVPVDDLARPALREADERIASTTARVRALLRAHPRELARDPRGALVLRDELVAIAPTDEALAAARAAGFSVRTRQRIHPLDLDLVVLQVPPRTSLRRALRQLRKSDPAGHYDYNHVYLGAGDPTAIPVPPDAVPVPPTGAPVRLGLVDGGVDVADPAIRPGQLRRAGCLQAPPDPHGTAVAAVLMSGPGVQVHAADIYCGQPTGGAVSRLAEAFGWLAGEGVTVVNLSLAGPPNLLLEALVVRMQARGHVLVAAVGNDGPAAPERYPAAYPGVIGVAAVDARGRPLPESPRGPQVDVAALGLYTSNGATPRTWRGSSFAAPRVARHVARLAGEPGPQTLARVEQALASRVHDAGRKGRDPRFGWGVLADEDLRD
ncbi:S8 family serine peptidase [Arenimonas donghaensis]|uniref:Peptidase S8/S53 domain-containing protein n=1 Tax=Arenimonas donghaensis DSM 18148 = HO3-R19 TaxID=1121014 RepID=A0A087MGX1_9GAMM|nr:S8 family serine peptidase [Arenimonas donghaensis]KFL36124.1 hypothetical protein N788_13710 [Arenimonas donghaensis DSM 18148 = HO3-R19]